MNTDPNDSIKEEVVTGIFGLLNRWWVWATFVAGAAMYTGILSKSNLLAIIDKIIEIVKITAGKL